jgi:hypothetical protein
MSEEFINIYPKSYIDSFSKGHEVMIRLRSFDFGYLAEINSIAEKILIDQNLTIYMEYLKTALKEMVQNSIKATQKRVFFESNGWNLEDQNQDQMEEFKLYFQKGKANLFPKLLPYTSEIFFQKIKNYFFITVRNLGTITKNENLILTHMFERGWRMDSVPDLLEEENHHKEGGGLGISMIIVIGKKFYSNNDLLTFMSIDGVTEFCLKLPINRLNK